MPSYTSVHIGKAAGGDDRLKLEVNRFSDFATLRFTSTGGEQTFFFNSVSEIEDVAHDILAKSLWTEKTDDE